MKNWPISFHVAGIAVLTGFSLVLLTAVPSKSDANLPYEPQTLPLPELKVSEIIEDTLNTHTTAETEPAEGWTEKSVTIKRNDSLSSALERIGVGASIGFQIGKTDNHQLLTNLKVGDHLTVWVDSDNQLQRIVYAKSPILEVELASTDEGFKIQEIQKDVEIRTHTAHGKIEGAFYLAAERAGLSAKSIMQLADMLAWDVDFARELHDGDYFRVIYEARYLDGEYIGDGDILAAQITTAGGQEIHNAFVMRNGQEVIGYYNEKGQNLKKAFLKAPLDTVRITSRFNPKRVHPIFGDKRPHRGVDYGAPTGTPIKVTGNGQVTYRGWMGGYGNVVKVRHNNGYETLYAHMSRFGKYKKGQMVKQGEVIGYVGSTGNSTGAHLHYEFHINGQHRDPLKIKFPDAGPIAAQYRNDFLRRSHFLLGQLERLDPKTQLAYQFE